MYVHVRPLVQPQVHQARQFLVFSFFFPVMLMST